MIRAISGFHQDDEVVTVASVDHRHVNWVRYLQS